MTFEEESVEFLKTHIDMSFTDLMGEHTINRIEWLEHPNYRPYALLKDDEGQEMNVICMFPPFIPSGAK